MPNHRSATLAALLCLGLVTPIAAQTTITLTDSVTPYDTTYDTTGNDRTFTIASGSATQSGEISGTGAVAKTGAGAITFSGTNTYSGGTTVSAGTLAVAVDANLGDTSGDVAVTSGASLTTGGYFGFNRAITLDGTGTSLSNNGELIVGYGGTGSLALTNNATVSAYNLDLAYTGGTGTVDISSGSAISSATVAFYTASSAVNLNDGGTLSTTTLSGAGNLNLAGGTLRFSNHGSIAANTLTTLTNSSTIDTNGFNSTLAGVLSGTGSLTKIGSGTLTLTGTNTHSGGTTVTAGTLAATSVAQFGTGDITASAGGDITVNALEIGGPRTLTVTGDGSTLTAGYVWLNRDGSADTQTLDIADGGAVTVTGTVSLADLNAGSVGNLNVTGTGSTLTATGNIYVGYTGTGNATVANGGTLATGGVLSANALSTFNLNDGGTLQVGGTNGIAFASGATFNANGGTIEVTGSNLTTSAAMTLGDTTDSTIDTNGLNATLAGTLAGSGALTKAGNGTLTLSGANTFSGETTLGAGTLELGHSNALQNSTAQLDGGTLSFGSLTSATFGGLAGSSDLALTNGSTADVDLTVGGNGASTTYSGALSGGGSLTKSGGGTLTLSGTNAFTGGLSANSGTVAAASAAALGNGDITVSGTLAGSGNLSIDQQVTVHNSGQLTTVGFLEIGSAGDGTLTLDNGGQVTSGTSTAFGVLAGASGTGSVTGENSRLNTTGTLYVGYLGTGTLDVGSDGEVVAGAINLGAGATGSGTINVNSGGTLSVSGTNTITGGIGTHAINLSGGTLHAADDLSTNYGFTLADGTTSLIDTDGYTVTLSGNLNGSGNLSFDGTLTLGGATSFTGQTNLTSGNTLVLDHEQALQNSTLQYNGGTLSFGTQTAIALGALNTGYLNFSLKNQNDDGVTLTIGGNNGDSVVDGYISASAGSLVKTGTGNLTLGDINYYTGSTTINGGSLSIDYEGSLGAAPGSVTADHLVFDGGTLANSNGSVIVLNENRGITLNAGGGTFAGDFTYNGIIAGTGDLTKTGDDYSTLTLGGANTFSGQTDVVAGTLQINHAQALQNSTLLLNGSGLVEVNGDISTLYLGGLSGSDNITVSSNDPEEGDGPGMYNATSNLVVGSNNEDTTYSGVIDGSDRTFTKTGTGTLVLSGNNTYGGDTTISGGTLSIAADTNLGDTSFNSPTLILNGGTLLTTADMTLSTDRNLAIGSSHGTLETATGTTLTVDSSLSTSNNLTKAGAGSLHLGSDATGLGGTVAVTGGEVRIANGESFEQAEVQLNGGTVIFGDSLGSATFDGLGGSTDLLLENENDGAVALTVGFGGSRDTDYSGVMSGSGSLTLATGTLQLSNANTFTGAVDVAGGELVIGHSNAVATQTITLDGDLGFAGVTSANLTQLSGSGSVTLQTDADDAVTLTVGSNNASTTFSGNITGTGGLTKTGTGDLTLSGSGSFTGDTTIADGTITLTNSNALYDSTVTTTGNLRFSGITDATLGNISGSQNLVLENTGGSALALDVGNNNSSTTFSGVISGDGSLSKSGSGTLTLSGGNTYTGATIASQGTLSISADSALGAAPVSATADHLTIYSATLAGTADLTLDANRGITLGGATISAAAGTTFQIDGNMSGDGSLTKTGDGSLILAGANTYAAGTTVSAGTLQGDSTSLQGDITNNAALVFAQDSAGTYAGAIDGTGDFTKSGSGNLSLSGQNTYTGTTTVSGGTLTLANTGDALSTATDVTLSNGATLDLGEFSDHIGELNLVNGTVTSAGGAGLYADAFNVQSGTLGVILEDNPEVSADLTKTTAGTVTLTNKAQHAGGTYIEAGVFNVSGSDALIHSTSEMTIGDSAEATVNVSGGGLIYSTSTLTLGDSSTGTGNLNITGPSEAFFDVTTLGDMIIGNEGTGNVTISGGGSLAAQTNMLLANGTNGTATVTVSGTDGGDPAEPSQFGAGGNIVIAGGEGSDASVTASAGAWVLVDGSVIIGAGTNSTGTLTLTGADTLLNFTPYGSAPPTVALATGTGSTAEFNILDGATATLADTVSTDALTAGPGTATVTLNNGTLATTAGNTLTSTVNIATGGSNTFATDSGTITLSGALSGDGALTKTGSGTLVLGAANTFTGDTTISAGTVDLQDGLALQSSTVNAAGGTVTFGEFYYATFGALEGSTGITLARSDDQFLELTVGGNNASTTYSGVLSSDYDGSLIKVGTGTLTLTGNNTFTGFLAIREGTVSVSSDANLGGVGDGAVDLLQLDGGTLATTASFDINALRGMSVGDTGTIDTATGTTLNLLSAFYGEGELTKAGAGELKTSASNEYFTGTVDITAGTFTIAHADALANGTVNVTNDNSLRFETITTANLGGLSGSGDVALENTASADLALTVGGNDASSTYSGVLSAGGSLTKTGTGTLTLTGSNTYEGGTTINAGTLSIAADAALGTAPGSATPGHLTVNGGTLATTASFELAANRGLTIGASGGTLNTADATTLTYAGDLAGSGELTKTGTGTLTLSGTTSHTGATTIEAGTVAYTTRDAYFNGGTGANPSVRADGTVAFSVGDSGDGLFDSTDLTDVMTNAFFSTGGTLELNPDLASGGTYDVSTVITDSDSGDNAINVTKTGAGTLALSGVNTYTGTTTVSAGTLQLGTTNALNSSSTVNVTTDATLDLNGYSPTLNNLAGTGTLALGSGTLTTGDADNHTLDLTVTGSGSLTKTGAGTVTLTGTNTYEGGTTLNAGTLAISADANLGDASGDMTLNGGTLLGTADLTLASGRSITLDSSGGTLEAAYPSTLTVESTLTGSGNLGLDGEGHIVLAAANDFTGTTTFLDGDLTVTLANGNALQNSELTTTGGLRFGSLTAATIGAISGSQGLLLENGSSAGVTLSVGGNNASTTHSGTINGAGGLTKVGSGTLTLGGSNSFSGDTSVAEGTLALTDGNALQNSTVILGSGEITFSSITDATFGGLAGSGTLSLPSDTLTVGGNDANTTYSGTLNGSSSTLIKTGTGNLTFSGEFNDYSSTVQLDEGTFTLGNANGLDEVAVDLNGGTLSFGALTSAELGNLTGTGNLALTNAAESPAAVALTVGANSDDATYAGVMSGTGSLTKSGSGTLTLSGAHTFTGETTVTGGTLALTSSGSLAGDLTLDNGYLTLGNATGLANSTVTLTSGDVSYNGVSAVTFGGLAGSDDLNLPSTSLTVGGNDANTAYSGTIQGSGSFIKVGDGNLTFSGSVYDSAPVQLDAGTLTLANPTALERSVLTLNGGALSFGTLTAASFNGLSGSPDLALTNAAATPAAVALTIGYDGGSSTYAGGLSGEGSLTKAGSGTLTLSGANTFTGGTTVDDGTLALATTGSLTGDVHLDSGTLSLANATGLQDATVHLNGGSLSYDSVSAVTFGGLAGSNYLNLPTTSLTVGANDADTSYSGTIYNSGAFIKAGDGTFTFSGSFSDGAAVRLDAGTFTLANSSALERNVVTLNGGSLSFGTLTSASVDGLSGSSNLALTNAAATPAAVALTIGADGGDSTYAGVLSGGGSLSKTGSGTFTLNGANTFTGNTTIEGGTLALGAAGSLAGDVVLNEGTLSLANANALAASTVNLNGGSLAYNGIGDATLGGISGSGSLDLPSSLTVGANDVDTSYTGTINYSGTFIKAGDGNLTFGGSFNDAAPVRLDAGTFTLGYSSALQYANVTLNGGALSFGLLENATLNGLGGSTNLALMNAASSPAAVALTIDSSNGDSTYNGVLSGDGSLVKTGFANFTLTGANTFTGDTTVEDGQLSISGTGSLTGDVNLNGGNIELANSNGLQSSTVHLSGGNLSFDGINVAQFGGLSGSSDLSLTAANASEDSVALTVGANNLDTTFSGNLSGDGSLIKTGTGTLILQGTSDYYGSTTVSAGTLAFNSKAAFYNAAREVVLESSNAERLSVAAGATATFRMDTTVTNSNSFLPPDDEDFVVTESDQFTEVDLIALLAHASFDNGANLGIDTTDAIGGAVTLSQLNYDNTSIGLTKSGAGDLVLDTELGFSGPTTITGGRLVLADGYALANSTVTTTAGLAFDTSSVTLGAISGSQSLSLNDLNDNAVNLTVGGNDSDTTFSGEISGSGSLEKSGGGGLTLSGANTYTGATIIADGTLVLGHVAALGSTSSLQINTDGTLDLNDHSVTIATLDGDGNIDLGSATLTTGDADNHDLYGTISGSGSLTKQGTGELTLAGNNTYEGTTTVSEGTLTLRSDTALGTTAGGTTVASGATLAFSNNITVGAEAIANSGTVTNTSATNTYAGVLSGTGNLTITGGSLNLRGENTYTGDTTVGDGSTLSINQGGDVTQSGNLVVNNGALDVTDSGTFTALGSATLNSDATPFATSLTVRNGATFAVTGDTTLNQSAAISITNGGTFDSAGNVTVNDDATLTATTGGTFAIDGQLSLVDNAGFTGGSSSRTTASSFVASGANTLQMTDGANLKSTGTATFGGTSSLTSNNGASLTVESDLILANGASDDVSLNLTQGTSTVTGDVQIGQAGTGSLAISQGSLSVGGAVVLGNSANSSGSLTVSEAGLYVGGTDGIRQGDGTANVSFATASLNITGSDLTTSVDLATTGTFSVETNALNATLSGTVSGDGALGKYGSGTLTLNGANTYTGNTNLNEGTLVVGHSQALQSSTVSLSGGSLSFGDVASATFGGLAGSGSLALDDVNLTVGGNNADASYSGNLSGTGALTKTGSGTQTLSGTNTFEGGTTVGGGTLAVTDATQLGSGPIAIQAGGTVSVAQTSTFSQALSVDGSGATLAASTQNDYDFFGFFSAIGSPPVLTNFSHLNGDLTVSNGGALTGSLLAFGTGADAAATGSILSGGTLTVTHFALGGDATAAVDLTVSGNDSELSSSILHVGVGNSAAATLTVADGASVLSGFVTLGDQDGIGRLHIADGGTVDASALDLLNANSQVQVDDGGVLKLSTMENFFFGTIGGINSGGLVTGAQTLLNGGTIAIADDSDMALNTDIALGTGTSSTIDTGNSAVTAPGVISGSGAFTKSGSGSLTVSGVNTYSGTTSVNGGTLNIAADSALGTVPGSATAAHLTLNGGTLATTASFELAANRGIALGASGGTLATADATTLTYAGIIDGEGTFTKTGTGTLILSGANAYTGATAVSDGTLSIAADSALGTAPGSATAAHLTLNGGTLATTASFGLAANRGIALGTSGGTFATADATTLTYGGIIDGEGTLTKTGTGTLSLAAANTFTGATAVSDGTLSIAADSALGTAPGSATAGHLTLDGGTLATTASFELAANRGIALGSSGGTVETADASTLSYSGIIDGDGALTKTGTGTLALSGTNTYTGGTTVDSGNLTANAATQFGTGAINITSGGAVEMSSTTTFLQDVTITGSGSRLTGYDNIAELVGEDFEFDPNNYTAFGANEASRTVTISDGGSLTGTLIAFDANTGQDMTINLSNGGQITADLALVVGANGGGNTSLNVDGTGSSISAENGGLIIGFANETATANVTVANGGAIVAGAIQVGAPFNNDAQGNLTIDDGGTVTTGFVQLDSKPSGSDTLKLNSGGTLEITGGTNALDSTLDNGVAFNGGTLRLTTNTFSTSTDLTLGAGTTSTVETSGVDATLSGTLSGTGSLTKTGDNTLTLSGANTYEGDTLVSAGTLHLANLTGSATGTGDVTIADGAALTGTGSIGGNLILAAGATFAPGNSPGVITIGGNAVFDSASIINLEIAGAGGLAGTDFDQINVIGALTLGGTLNIALIDDFTPSGSISFQVFNASSIGGTFAALNLTPVAGYTWNTADLTAGTLSLVASAVPEPATFAALAGLALLGFTATRRRRRA